MCNSKDPSQPRSKKDCFFQEVDYLFDEDNDFLSQGLSQTSILQHALQSLELPKYIDEAPIARTDDPLQWWKSRQRKYPAMSKLAKRYIGIPATSTPSEKVFSTAGNIISAKRSCLSPETANMLICLH